jgi:hypothetical protein
MSPRPQAGRGGHSPGHLRAALHAYLDSLDDLPGPGDTVEIDGERRPIRWLLGQLWNCSDQIPGHFVLKNDRLFDEDVATYAQAVRALSNHIATELGCQAAPPEVKFWEGGWTPRGVIQVPTGYARLPAGSAFATRLAKKLATESDRVVYIEMKRSKRGGYSHAVACWVPEGILPEVKRVEQETQERRAATRKAAELSRARRHGRELGRLTVRLGVLYPGMPEGERQEVVRRAFEVGSGRVGRTTRIEEDKRLELAVIAHVRHQHTHYDERLMAGEDRECVRKEIRDDVDSIITRWRHGSPGDRRR